MIGIVLYLGVYLVLLCSGGLIAKKVKEGGGGK